LSKSRAALAVIALAIVAAGAWWWGGAEAPSGVGGVRPAAAVGSAAPSAGGWAGGGAGTGSGRAGARAAAPGSGARAGVALERATGGIAGTVIGPDGAPLGGARVEALEEVEGGDRTVGATSSGEDGAYAFGGLADGLYVVAAVARGTRRARLEGVEIRDGELRRGVDLLLEPGARVAGRVVAGADGRLVQGAVVMAHTLAELERPALSARPAALREQRAQATARTDADGGFVLEGLGPGVHMLTAKAPGFRTSAAVRLEVAAGEEAWLELRLSEGSWIAGRVVDASGAGIAGARVEALPEQGRGGPWGGGGRGGGMPEGGETTSGEDGAYRIDGISGRRFRVTAWPAEGSLAPASRGGVRPNTDGVDLVLEAGGSISGTVVDAATGAPIGGATVDLGESGYRVTAASSDDGSFVLGGVPAQELTLRGQAEGYAVWEETFQLAAGEARAGVAIELLAGGVVSGQVIAEGDGAPLPGAVVHVFTSSGDVRDRGRRGAMVELMASGADMGAMVGDERMQEAERSLATTDEDGRFRLAGLSAGPAVVYAAHADHPGASADVTIAGPGEEQEVVIALPEGGRIVGRVLEGGEPRADAQVFAFSFLGRARAGTTDERGDYELKGLGGGSYFVSLRSDADGGGGMAGMQAKTANVEPGRETRVDFGTEARVRITGRVTEAGAPVTDTRLQLFGAGATTSFQNARTDDAGRYQLQAEPGRYILRVRDHSVNLEVPEGIPQLERDIEMPLGAAEGVVVDAANGQPLRARVAFYKAAGGEGEQVDTFIEAMGAMAGDDRSDENDGTFRVERLAPGTYTVVARLDGYVDARLDGVVVPASGVLGNLELSLEPGGVLRGQVRDALGAPVPRPTVWAVAAGAGDVPGGQPPQGDEEGRFEVRRFAPGTYVVTVLGGELAPWRREVEFPGGELELAPVLSEGGTLEVAVRTASGAPAPGAAVTLRYPNGDRVVTGFIDFMQEAQPAGADGILRRSRLPAGPLRVEVEWKAPDGSVQRGAGEAAVREGGEGRVVVPLAVGG
jgi:hypothetical protein